MEAKGEDAPPKPTGFTELERTYIAIGIACGILAIIVSIAVIAVRNNFIHHLFLLLVFSYFLPH